MKFTDILAGKKVKAAAVAREIVALESRLPKLKEAVDEAERGCVALRQHKLAGEKLSTKDSEATFKELREAELDVQAARQSLEQLRSKLVEVAADELPEKVAETDAAVQEASNVINGLKEEAMEHLLNFAKAWTFIYGAFPSSETLAVFSSGLDAQAFKARFEQARETWDASARPFRAMQDAVARHRHLLSLKPQEFADEILKSERAAK